MPDLGLNQHGVSIDPALFVQSVVLRDNVLS